jgi:hypothetical protein
MNHIQQSHSVKKFNVLCENALFITAYKTARRKNTAKTGKGTSSETAVAYLSQQNYPAGHTEWLRENHDQPHDSQFSSAHFCRVHSAYI